MSPSNDKPLRQLAVEKIHGKGSNPSQLGDPISMKAETANSHPTENDYGATSESKPQPTSNIPESSGGSHEEKTIEEGKTLRGMKKDGSQQPEGGENKTLMGDPTSLKAETSSGKGGQGDNGPSRDKQTKRDGSKL